MRIRELSGDVKQVRSSSNPKAKTAKTKLTAKSLNLFDRDESRSRSGGRKQKTVSLSRDITMQKSSPKREIFEAKYEKFLSNKK